LTVLGFTSSSHGQSTATLSCSDPAVNVQSLKTYDWPVVDLPSIEFPYDTHQKANTLNEEASLKQVSDTIDSHRAQNKDVGAIIIEPITAYDN